MYTYTENILLKTVRIFSIFSNLRGNWKSAPAPSRHSFYTKLLGTWRWPTGWKNVNSWFQLAKHDTGWQYTGLFPKLHEKKTCCFTTEVSADPAFLLPKWWGFQSLMSLNFDRWSWSHMIFRGATSQPLGPVNSNKPEVLEQESFTWETAT